MQRGGKLRYYQYPSPGKISHLLVQSSLVTHTSHVLTHAGCATWHTAGIVIGIPKVLHCKLTAITNWVWPARCGLMWVASQLCVYQRHQMTASKTLSQSKGPSTQLLLSAHLVHIFVIPIADGIDAEPGLNTCMQQCGQFSDDSTTRLLQPGLQHCQTAATCHFTLCCLPWLLHHLQLLHVGV